MKKSYFYASLLALLGVSLANVFFSVLSKYVIDALLMQDSSLFLRYLLMLIGVMLVLLVCEYQQQIWSQHYINGAGEELHGIAVETMLVKEHRQVTASYLSMIARDIETVKELYFSMRLSLFQGLIGLFISCFALFALDPVTAGILLFLSLLPVVIPYLFSRSLSRLQDKISDKSQQHMVALHDILSGLLVIQNSLSLFIFKDRILNKYHQIQEQSRRKNRLTSAENVLIGFIFYATTVMIFLVGGWQVLAGRMTIGSMVAIYSIASELVNPIHLIASSISEIQASRPLYKSFMKLKEQEDFLAEPLQPARDFESLTVTGLEHRLDRGRILDFGQQEMRFEKGKKYLLTGPNGCGKSTFLEFLSKNHSYQKGSIQLNGQEVAELSYAQVQSYLTYLPQKAVLFHDTIWNNLTLYRLCDEKKVMDLLALCGLTNRFPTRESLEERVDHDTNLSGGQKQKLALIRGILQEKQLLLLDESLSALDEQSYQQLEEFLLQEKEWTVLHISHRAPLAQYDQVIELG